MTGKRVKPKNEKFLDKDDLARELSYDLKFTLSDTKIFMNGLQAKFEDALEQGYDVDWRGFIHLYVQNLPARRGVNARESKLRGETVYANFPPSKRAVIKLSKNMTDLLRSPEKRKVQNSKTTKEALRQMKLDEVQE